MKRTEKIEIRLSHEEKTSLSTLAQGEGRSVSDLVRGLIDRYMSLNRDRLPRKTPWGLFALIAVSGFFAGHLGTYFAVQSHSHLEIYQLQATIGNSRIDVPITRTEGESTRFTIPHKAGDIILTADVKKGSGALSVVDVTLCQISTSDENSTSSTATSCHPIASPRLSFNTSLTSSISFDAADDRVSLTLSPPISRS